MATTTLVYYIHKSPDGSFPPTAKGTGYVWELRDGQKRIACSAQNYPGLTACKKAVAVVNESSHAQVKYVKPSKPLN